MTIRKARLEDLEQIFVLVKEFATSFSPDKNSFEDSFTQILEDESAMLCIFEIESSIVGYCLAFDHYAFYANGLVTWVEEIMVHKNHRKKGIGKALMDNIENWARSRKSRLIALATRRASSFYKAVGYDESATFFRKLIEG